MKTFHNQSLKPYHTFGTEVSADEFIILEKKEEVIELARRWRSQNNLGDQPVAPAGNGANRLLILGGGSNVLFTGDFHGTVVKIGTKGILVLKEDKDEVIIEAAAGEDWDAFVAHCVERGWHGLENLSGIPGNVGSSPIQNIGAYGAELQEYIHYVEFLDLQNCQILKLQAGDCRFGYRDSIFKRDLKGKVIILSVAFRLSKKFKPVLSYQALAGKFEGFSSVNLTAIQIRAAILEIRNSKLPDPKIIGNAGSFFKNPVVGEETLEEIKSKFPGVVYFINPPPNPLPNIREGAGGGLKSPADRRPPTADYKLAAGWLIEQCGWKGYREGDAGVHQNQALVLVNYGNATGKQIFELSEKIMKSVQEKFGVKLEREVNVI
jgi:UDP-N-acetylmuramate dehydrogenase